MAVFVLTNLSCDTLSWDLQMVSFLERQALHSSHPLRLQRFQVYDVKILETPGSLFFFCFLATFAFYLRLFYSVFCFVSLSTTHTIRNYLHSIKVPESFLLFICIYYPSTLYLFGVPFSEVFVKFLILFCYVFFYTICLNNNRSILLKY